MILGIIVVLGSLLAVLLLWVLLAQISILADTYRNEYYLSFGRAAKAELVPLPDDILIRLRFAFLTKEFYPLHFSPGKKKKKAKPEKPRKRKRKKAFPFHRALRVLKSFNIKYFRLEVDTDNYLWNAYLWPVVYWIRPLGRHVSINFQGRNECRLLIQNRIWRIAWAWFFG